MIFQAYVEWQDNPVLTSVQTTGLPISEIEFPAITICGQGSIYEVITLSLCIKRITDQRNNSQVSDNVLDHQFNRYVRSKGKDPDALTDPEREQLKTEMVEDLYPGQQSKNKAK